jgi:DNA topoisomerase-1
MAKNLVIVESPAKAGTIGKYLGPDYEVLASMGHVRDLPASKLGVEVDQNFEPHYIIPIKARKTITALKAALKGKEKVLLATDLDREGEAIAWHISKALDLENQKGITVERITFDEITKPAILAAVAHPRSLDLQLVDAQQARRVLDRLVGYSLSPVLWKKIYKGLSAGRVQSVALRIITERERERLAFNPVEYWSLKALVAKKDSPDSFESNLVEYTGKKIEQLTLKNKEEVDSIVSTLHQSTYQISSIDAKQVKRRPSAPYTTSTLQQDAVNKLGYSSKRVMQIAQKLYEAGLITYMRTDSVSLAATAVESIREYVGTAYGQNFLPTKPNTYLTKSKGAQEAHEAIRPTNPQVLAKDVPGEAQAQKVYELIWKRTLASQMKEAELEQTAVSIKAAEATFRANGQRVVFPGFLQVWNMEEKADNRLPELKKDEFLNLVELLPEQHFTEPPPRYTEASLIKALEEQGIGRPSTYAPTIDTLVQRRYVTIDQRRFIPEEVGYLVTDLLVAHFPEIVDVSFTADMEGKLDLIAEGQANYVTTLSDFWKPFSEQILVNTEKIEKIDTTTETDKICPNCNSPMLIKMGRFGKFLACSKFPDCKTTQPLEEVQPSGLICPVCGKPFSEKRARKGIFYGCSGYPDCKVAIWKKEYLPAKIEELKLEKIEMPFQQASLDAFNELGIEAKTPMKRVAKETKPATKKLTAKRKIK